MCILITMLYTGTQVSADLPFKFSKSKYTVKRKMKLLTIARIEFKFFYLLII